MSPRSPVGPHRTATVWPLLSTLSVRGVMAATAAGAVAELAAVALMGTATWLIARAAQQPSIAVLTLAIVGVRALALSRGSFRYLERLASHDAALGALAALRERVYTTLARLAPTGTAMLRDGDTLSRLVADVDAVQDLLVRCVLPAAVAILVGAAAATVTTMLLSTAGAVLAGGLLVAGVLVPAGAYRCARRGGGQLAETRAGLAVQGLDLVDGAAELDAYGARPDALAVADTTARRLAVLECADARRGAVALAAVLAIQGATTAGVILTALHAAEGHALSTVLVPVLALTTFTTFETIIPLPTAALRWIDVSGAAARLTALFEQPARVAEPCHSLPLPAGPLEIELRGVRVRYAPDRAPALDGVDLRLPPGHRVALVGASGSGKSTVLAALLRFVVPEVGTFTVNGRDVCGYSCAELRRRIGGSTQDAYIFHGTLRDNLGLARPGASDAELADAARRARLLDWIERLPAGFDTMVGADGAQLSGGQRQRLVLARALLADPAVLLLDEPVEGLDPPTAQAVLAEALQATRGRTTVLVTHCLTGLEQVDEIVVLDGGRVVQRGTHRGLIARPGRYQELWDTQRGQINAIGWRDRR